MTPAQMKWNAVDYAQNSSAQYAWAQSLLKSLALSGSEDILDIGCGDGKITAEMTQMVSGRVIGVDSSNQMVQLANSQNTTESNLAFRQMDASNLAFRAEFDLVFSNAVLHWVRDHRAVLAGITQALRTGGRTVLSMGGKGNATEFLPIVDDVIRRDHWRACFEDFVFPYAFYGIEDYMQWLPEAGLQAKRIELVPKDMVHDSVAELKGWIRTTWLPYTNRLAQEQRESFIDELVGNYLEQYPVDSFGRTHISMIRLEVEAVKV